MAFSLPLEIVLVYEVPVVGLEVAESTVTIFGAVAVAVLIALSGFSPLRRSPCSTSRNTASRDGRGRYRGR